MDTWIRIIYVLDGEVKKVTVKVKDVSAALDVLKDYITYTIIEFSYYHV